MKKIANVQVVELTYSPTVYTFDQIRHRLFFNRILEGEDILKAIAEIGKEMSLIKSVRVLAAKTGTDQALRELNQITRLITDLSEVYNNIDIYRVDIANGSGEIVINDLNIKFYKPRVVEFIDGSK